MTVLHLAARFGHVDVLEVLRGKVPWSMASVKVRRILNLTPDLLLTKMLATMSRTGIDCPLEYTGTKTPRKILWACEFCTG